jgi:hypothetical protein
MKRKDMKVKEKRKIKERGEERRGETFLHDFHALITI